MARRKWSTVEVGWLINRLHVSATEAEIRAEMEWRMTKAGWTDAARRDVIAYAIKKHAKNRALFVGARF